MEDKAIYLLFLFAISLHNIEEALWLPEWSKSAKKFHKQTESNEFRFAVLMVTLLAVLATALFLFFPEIKFFQYAYFGFLGAMILNIFFPHLAATIILKKYAPGLISGILLNIPINLIIIIKSINSGTITVWELIISSIISAVVLVGSLPLLFKISRTLNPYKLNEK